MAAKNNRQPPKVKKTRWTTRKRMFVKAYCGEAMFNAAEAARLAGFSRASAARIAVRLMQDPKIRKAIDKRLRKFAMSGDEAMARLSAMGRGSIKPFMVVDRETGEMVLDLGNEDAQRNLMLVKKVKQKKTRRTIGRGEEKETEVEIFTELELHDAKDANVQMAKIRGLYTEKDAQGNPLQPLYKVYVGVNPDDV